MWGIVTPFHQPPTPHLLPCTRTWLALAGAATSIIFAATNILSWQNHVFVTTKDVFCRDKSRLVATKHLLQFFCRDKIMFAAANICCDKSFVTTKLLSQQAYSYPVFSQGTLVYAGIPHKRRVLSTHVCHDKMLDTCGSSRQWYLVTLSSLASELISLTFAAILLSPFITQGLLHPILAPRLPSLHQDGSSVSLPQYLSPLAKNQPQQNHLLAGRSKPLTVSQDSLLPLNQDSCPLPIWLKTSFSLAQNSPGPLLHFIWAVHLHVHSEYGIYCLWITQEFALQLHKG